MLLIKKWMNITIILSLFVMFLYATAVAQTSPIDHWETVVYANDTWSYLVGNSEPDANWRQLSFDDNAWSKGPGGIGYGDDDDNTVINPPILSLYLRIKFNIIDISKIEYAILHVDYDDAFVAYINDVEVARAGISGNPPAHDQAADSQHDARLFEGGLPEAFDIDKAMVQTCLNENENVLAIQVHNISTESSDMSSTTFLSLGINDGSRSYRPVPNWFAAPFQFSSSDIPIMVIDTEGRQIVDEPKTMARMGIINNGEDRRNNLSDPFNEYDGWIGIEYRGNASMYISDKKPFTFETRNADGTNNNVKLLGMPRENDFILRAGFIDKTLMRDALAYDISRKIGRWAPRTRHVELVLNGNYEGVYVIVEKIKPDNDRLNIVRMDTSDISGEELTGGYVWVVQQSDNDDVVFLNDRREGNHRVLKYPKPDEVTPEQFEYIRQYEESFRNVMKSSTYNDPINGYPAYIDVSTFIDEIIVQEATSNSDAYGWSSFFYKDRSKKMCAGPAWDFDQALTNSTYNDGHLFDAFVIEKTVDWARPSFWDRLWADTDFKNQVKEKWVEYRQDPLRTDRLFAFIDSMATYLNEAQQRNFTRWPILGVPIWRSLPGVEDRDTYQKEVDYMKYWLEAHLTWMDTQLGQPSDSIDVEEGLVAYYKFDQTGAAFVKDHSGNGLYGDFVGDLDYVDGVQGTGLLFNGIDTYVNCGNSSMFDIEEEITLMAWIKAFDIGNSEHNPWITKGDHSWALKEFHDGSFEFFVYDGGWQTSRIALDPSYNDQWHHYVGVYDGEELKIYMDGILNMTTDHSGTIATSDHEVHLGHNSEVSDRYFNGILDEVRIYNIALSDEEIEFIYNNFDTAVADQSVSPITHFMLYQNYPNPFNPMTTISYSLPTRELVSIKIYDMLGQEIVTLINEKQSEGDHSVNFDASGLASGVYFYQLHTRVNSVDTKKMILMR